MKKICGFALLAALGAGLLSTDTLYGEDFQRPGLRADRARGVVEIEAEATGIKGSSPLEFILIEDASGHDYEALATTRASADDIKQALEFIGLKPGRTVDQRKLRFWPRGARIDIFVELVSGDGEAGGEVPLADYLYDSRIQSSPSPAPFVFTGSLEVDDPENSERRVLAAGALDPRSIISTYNEKTTLIDVPVQAEQGAVYGKIQPNPQRQLAEAAPLKIIIRKSSPELKEVDLRLQLSPGAAPGSEICTLLDAQDAVLNEDNQTLAGALARMSELVESKSIPHVRLDFDPQLSISAIRAACKVLATVDSPQGIRVEPPAPGALYYRAFLPDPVMARREQRGLQPPELCLKSVEEGELQAELIITERVWSEDGSGESSLQTERRALEGPDAFSTAVTELSDSMPVLLAYTPEELKLATLMSYVGPVMQRYGTVFVMPLAWCE